MGNHCHLLLKTPDANLSRGMHWFGTAYTRKFNLQTTAAGIFFKEGSGFTNQEIGLQFGISYSNVSRRIMEI